MANGLNRNALRSLQETRKRVSQKNAPPVPFASKNFRKVTATAKKVVPQLTAEEAVEGLVELGFEALVGGKRRQTKRKTRRVTRRRQVLKRA